MARQTKSDIILERETEMSSAAFDLFLMIRHSRLDRWTRDDLMRVHFDLSYHYAKFDNRIHDILHARRQRIAAQQPGPWPADHFEGRA